MTTNIPVVSTDSMKYLSIIVVDGVVLALREVMDVKRPEDRERVKSTEIFDMSVNIDDIRM